MNKFVTKLAGLSIGLALALGVGFSVGERAPKAVSAADATDTLTRATTGIADGGNYGTWSGKSGGSSSAVYAGQSGGGSDSIQLRTNYSNSGVIVTTSGGTLKSISVVWNASTANDRTLNIYGKNTAYSAATDLYNNSTRGDSLGTIVCGTSTSLTVTGSYAFFGMRSNSGALYLTSITVVWTTGGPVTLPTPTGVAYDDATTKVTWNAVASATGYKVSVDSGEFTADGVDGTSWSAANLTKDVQHTISVKAIGDGGTNYNDSAASTAYNFTPKAPTTIQSVSVTGLTSPVANALLYSTVNLTAAATNATGTGTSTFTWASSNTDVATVNSSTGVLTYKGAGSTNITATSNFPAADGGSNVGTLALTVSSVKGVVDNPFTVAEARSVATSTAAVACVRGVIYNVNKYDSTYKSITYWISDDGTGSVSSKDGLQIYSGKGLDGADFSALTDLTVGSTVVVEGDLKIFQSTTYELDKNSVIKSITLPKTLSSIAVKTAPTKTAYKSGESFDPTGLVITATYSDSSTEDFSYAAYSGSFSFSPSTITAAGDVTITFREKTCKQAVTLVTVTNVTGVASAPTEVYKDGSIEPSSVTLNVVYSDSSVGTVTPDSVTCDTSAVATGVTATATYNAATGVKTATFTVDVKKAPVWDYITDTLTNADFSASSTTYATTTNIAKNSDARYTANTAYPNETQFRIRTANNGSGIFTTASGGYINQIIAVNLQSSRTIYVYGSNDPFAAFSDISDGELLGTVTPSKLTLTVDGDYAYVGLYANDSTTIDSLTFKWKVEGAEYPLDANPVLSPSGSAEVAVGKNLVLSVTTSPVDSDERLIITSADVNYVTVSGSDRTFVIHGVAETTSPVNVTVAGAKGAFSSSIAITVVASSKSYEDEVLDVNVLGITSYDSDPSHSYSANGVDFTCFNVMRFNGIQFKSDKSNSGYISNKEVLFGGENNAIKSITLVMNSNNSGSLKVYEGTAANPDSEVTVSGEWANKGVNTFVFSSGKTFFKLLADSTTNVDKIIIELVDAASSVLAEARAAANSILTDLAGLCGGSGSGFVTQEQWDTLNAHVRALNLSEDAKQLLKDASRVALDNLAQGSAVIENAMGHYDACVVKFGYEPEYYLSNATPSPRVTPTISEIVGGSNITLIIVIATSISVTLVAGYFLLKKRKQK